MLMPATTEFLSPTPPTTAMTSCGFYRYRVPKTIPVSPWPSHKQLCKRLSSSLSLFESSVSVGSPLETISLPSSPIPYVSLDEGKRKNSFWGRSDCGEDAPNSLLYCPSSGYCSGSSSEGSWESYFPTSPVPKNCPSEEPYPQGQFTASIPYKDSETSKDQLSTKDADEGDEGCPQCSPSRLRSECSEDPLRLSDLPSSLSQPDQNTSPNHEAAPSSGLSSVTVPSKRSCSESSTSSSGGGPISADEGSRRRVKDEEGFIRRAACVCVNEDESKVVLISSKNEGGGWLVPGGGLESGEGEVEAAVREAWEEAGITGRVKRCLGIFQSEDEVTHKKKRTAVYVLTVGEQHSAFPEARLGRVREWFSIDTAVDHLSHCKPHQTAYLRAL